MKSKIFTSSALFGVIFSMAFVSLATHSANAEAKATPGVDYDEIICYGKVSNSYIHASQAMKFTGLGIGTVNELPEGQEVAVAKANDLIDLLEYSVQLMPPSSDSLSISASVKRMDSNDDDIEIYNATLFGNPDGEGKPLIVGKPFQLDLNVETGRAATGAGGQFNRNIVCTIVKTGQE